MWREKLRNKRKNLKNSIFIVNKLYLFMIFILLSIVDWSLAVYSFFSYVVIYILHIFTRRLPIENKGEFEYITKTYKKVDGEELKMDIWYPNQSKEEYPLVLFAHGGGWISGFRNQPNNISWCKYLASNGFVAASIDYRFGIKNEMDDLLVDYDDALKFLKSHAKEFKICPKKIILMGLSAGGHLSLLFASYYSYMQDKDRMKGICGVVGYYAPSDLSDLLSQEARSFFARYATIRTLKGRPDEKSEHYELYSPIKWISESMPPVLLVHGKQDQTVPFSSSIKLVKKLGEYKVLYKFLVHPNGGHCFEMNSKDFRTVNILKKTISWMRGMITEE